MSAKEFFKTIFEGTEEGVMVIDKDYVITNVNPALLKKFGYKRKDVIGKCCHEVSHKSKFPCKTPRDVCPHKEVMKTGKQARVVHTHFDKNGREIYVELTAFPIKDQGDKITHVIEISRDITKHKKADDTLKDSEETYRTLVENVQGMIYRGMPDWSVEVIGGAAKEITGYSKDELTKGDVNWIDIIHPEDKKRVMKESKTINNKSSSLSQDYRIIKKDASTVWVRDIKKSFHKGKKLSHVDGVVLDITGRKQTEDFHKVLGEILELSLADIPLEEMLEKTIDKIVNISWLVLEKKGSIFLVEDAPNVLVLKAQRGLAKPLLTTCENVPFGRCICGRAAATKKIAFVECVDKDHENTYNGIKPHGHYCVPILSSERVLGVINLYVKEGHHRDKSEESFLNAITNSLAGIIERKKAEEELRLRSEIIQNMDEGVYLIKMDSGEIVWTNPKFEEMFGYEKGEMIGKHVSIVNAPTDKDPEKTAREIIEVLEKTGKWQGEIENIKKDGTHFRCYANVSIFDHPVHGKVLISVHTDITERKEAEDALRKRDHDLTERYKELNLLYGISRLAILPDFSLETVLQSATDLIPPAWHYPEVTCGRIVFKGNEYRTGNFKETKWRQSKDIVVAGKNVGQVDVFYLKEMPELDEGPFQKEERKLIDAFSRQIGAIIERKKAEEKIKKYAEELEQSNQLKGLFTDILRHDLLNPTGVIRNIAEIMEYDENLKGSQEIEVIKRNVTKLEEIIQNASQYAKLESEDALEKSEINLTGLIENIITDLHPYSSAKKMKVRFIPDREHKLNASGAIESVFVNILSNAIKYSPEETDIKITIEDEGNNKRISVTDQGDGILDENKEAVFDRFTRKDKRGVRGTGLGLAITKRIVDLHKGNIWVEDNPEGKGSVFIVEIPK